MTHAHAQSNTYLLATWSANDWADECNRVTEHDLTTLAKIVRYVVKAARRDGGFPLSPKQLLQQATYRVGNPLSQQTIRQRLEAGIELAKRLGVVSWDGRKLRPRDRPWVPFARATAHMPLDEALGLVGLGYQDENGYAYPDAVDEFRRERDRYTAGGVVPAQHAPSNTASTQPALGATAGDLGAVYAPQAALRQADSDLEQRVAALEVDIKYVFSGDEGEIDTGLYGLERRFAALQQAHAELLTALKQRFDYDDQRFAALGLTQPKVSSDTET